MDSPVWCVWRRIAFRFGVILGGLLIFPFPIDILPKANALAALVQKPLDWLVVWFAQAVLGMAEPAHVFNGSGDRVFDYVQLLVFALVAVVGTVAWSILDRRRTAHPRLADGAHVALRYSLAAAMLSYGFSKVLRRQFDDLDPARLFLHVGDVSPMGLLWTFMSYSKPYTIFAGLGEVIGGVLLMWRRTATIGALIVIPIMTNVVLLNLCYDVPVKLYSTQLLVMAVLIALPGARRLISAALGHATSDAPPRVRWTPRWERVRGVAAWGIKIVITVSICWRFRDSIGDEPVHELQGNWAVDQFVADGVARPPLATDPERWCKLSANDDSLALWLVAGNHEPPTGVGRAAYGLAVDATTHAMTVTVDRDKQVTETWRYVRPDPDHLVIDGEHRGKRLHVTLHREPESRLLGRGFHWINEAPFSY